MLKGNAFHSSIIKKQQQNREAFIEHSNATTLIKKRENLWCYFNWFYFNLDPQNNMELILSKCEDGSNKVRSFPPEKVRVDRLFINFLFGEENTYDQIICGNYIQAANLVRQELEILASMREESKNANRKKPPNIRPTDKLNIFYGTLSEAAHVRNEKLRHAIGTKDFKRTPTGVSLTPPFDINMSVALLNLHLLISNQLLLDFIKNAQKLYSEIINNKKIIENIKMFEKELSDDYEESTQNLNILIEKINDNRTSFDKQWDAICNFFDSNHS
ncbi:hypothetical protein [Entomomonas asaccharolytica]|uniref:Uncharacterized protein n=1 Tax=Entomomonas asaccharolytica TaxID=2785331 RepID=A0A974NEB8_9GAMM|nr:hypothetical protein [Entomomonas asaccharolytica]QQP85034.1 hypothetical protein JHT90_11645 [Entomomonas asaccharolytica]